MELALETPRATAARMMTVAPLVEELRASFYRVGQALASSLNLEETLRLIAESAAEITRAQAATVHLLEDEGRRLIIKAATGPALNTLSRLQALDSEALTETIARHRQAVQVADLTTDPRLSEHVAQICAETGRELRAYLAVPLTLRGQVMGVLAIGRAAAGGFSTAEVELLSSFASQAAIAIENTRLFSALQDKLREMSGLYEVSLAFGALPKLEDTYGQLVARIAGLLDVERCALMIPRESGDALVAQPQAFGFSTMETQDLVLPLAEENASSRVWQTLRPYLTNNAQADSGNLNHFAQAFGDRSLLIVPMVVEGKPLGLIRASNKRSGRFTNHDMRLLTVFATQAAVVLRNAMLYREVARERQRLRAIFDNASDGITIIDKDRRIIAFNPAMERLTGWTAEQAYGVHCHDVYQSHDEKGTSLCDVSCPLSQLLCQPPTLPYIESIMTTRDGHQRDIAVSYSPIAPSGDPDSPEAGHVVAIVRDISRSKDVERQKTQFVSTVSHELRTPLASIKASVGVLIASMPEETPDPIMRLLRNIDRSTHRLESIVLDLLDLSRLQSGRVRLSKRHVDLAEISTEAIATVKPLTDAKAQTIELVAPKRAVTLHADRQRLGQVILNLLSNAHKYSPAGGKITVRLSRRLHDVVCAVEDSGPGIPSEEQELIFERFYRPENGVTQANVGTGLGLPIAKALVELHGGRIWLRSEVGRGSAFYFSVPRGDAAGAEDHVGSSAGGVIAGSSAPSPTVAAGIIESRSKQL